MTLISSCPSVFHHCFRSTKPVNAVHQRISSGHKAGWGEVESRSGRVKEDPEQPLWQGKWGWGQLKESAYSLTIWKVRLLYLQTEVQAAGREIMSCTGQEGERRTAKQLEGPWSWESEHPCSSITVTRQFYVLGKVSESL